ncbi:hypothetical protein OAI81_01040 [Candidatus Pelagibacter sp.]|nr:hypothetical protein [Candidatus Pelagibacter sp.]
MRQFIYKVVIAVLAIILVFEFTIGKKISQFGGKVDAISSKEGRKETVNKLREEIKKAVKKERYLSKEDAKLINEFILKIQKELNEAAN